MSPFGKITDYFFGKNDIQLQTVRFIGNIEERLQEDYLRILRYFRFLGTISKCKYYSKLRKNSSKKYFSIKESPNT